jgi:HAD superfamily hydrolase (TIGR01509 family)
MKHSPAAILFDFDGVIVNSEPLHFQAFYHILKSERIQLTEAEYWNEMIGFDDRGAFRYIFQKHGRVADPPTLLRIMTAKSQVMMDLIQKNKYHALPGVEEFVRGVWRHYPLAICTGALREEVEVMLEGVSLRDCFSVIVAAEDVTVGKPDPQGYLLAAKLLSEKIKKHLHPEDCLIIEDAPSVCQHARQAGFKTLGVATSTTLERLAASADHAIPSLHPDQVLKVLPNLEMTV